MDNLTKVAEKLARYYTAEEVLAVWAHGVKDLDKPTKGEEEALVSILRPWIQAKRKKLDSVYKNACVDAEKMKS